VDALVAVRRRIAATIVGDALGRVRDGAHHAVRAGDDDARLGTICLRPHQVDAVRRIRHALRVHGGALLADAPGLGKTFVALAIARAYGSAMVAAPAALRAQWMRSASLAGVGVEWCTLETLSRRVMSCRSPLLIVDEAHHLRNQLTRRYAHAAALAVGRHVLLLSATPVHNRTSDRDALLALFFGSRTEAPAAHALATMIVRRRSDPALLPACKPVRWRRSPPSPDVGAALRALPPPLPAADGRAAIALLRLTLARAWSSSLVALDATLRRALHQAAAIDDALAAGRWPTRRELRAWVTTPESSQLAFPELVAARSTADLSIARRTLAVHTQALRALRSLVAGERDLDAQQRGALMRRIVGTHESSTIIAFSCYAGTIDALWHALRFDAGVVAITARGVRSAGGGLSRQEVLSLLATERAGDVRTPIRLVLSTDLLGEGLDLRAASVIVHLDQPWTPARLEQRVGRAARLGSTHAAVTVYALRPPPGAARLLALAARLRVKRTAMQAGLAATAAREELRTLVRPWLAESLGSARVAAVRAPRECWVAAVRDGRARMRVVIGDRGGIEESDARLAELFRQSAGAEATTPSVQRVRAARGAIREWLRADASSRVAGADGSAGAARATIMRRLDESVRAAPLNQRAALQHRVARVRARLAAVRGAGVERALTAAMRANSVEVMLDAVERMNAPQTPEGPAAPRSRLLALLMFEPTE
jgi:superfamily II DNA or RNA helicase